ncbi:MAG: B-box zinc finger protein [Bryobacterales bacterium]|nr:B-box zinc finger protein [Bryobacterales bacterium]
MNCINHPDVNAVAYCRACGKALCPECKRTSQAGVIYCEEHMTPSMTAAAAAPAPAPAPVRGVSPGLAFVLGLIPGVGAIYNGQYAKGLVHAVIFGMLATVQANGAGGAEALFGVLIAAFLFYMAFEAYHTARKRMLGEPVDEFSSLIRFDPESRSFPVGAVALIAIGVLFLLNTLDILHIGDIVRFWPVALIAIGVYMLYVRLSGNNLPANPEREVRDEPR